jgi:ABC-type glycerol-3-phosphate transport system substrate-binding protein
VVGGLLAASMAPAHAVNAASLALAASRPLTPTFYQWIIDLHPSVPQVNDEFKATAPLNFQIAPVQGFGVDRFVAEARDRNSTWDLYVGMTPFAEMSSLIAADVIEPWDNYIPQDVLNDLIPSVRNECTVDGHLYSWPFLLDIIRVDNEAAFWTTGACLFKYGQNKNQAAAYMTSLTYSPGIWKDSISGTPTAHPGQLPPYESIYAGWSSARPPWMQDWVPLVFSQLN